MTSMGAFVAAELHQATESPSPGTSRVRTVERAFATLEYIAELGGTATLSELSRGLEGSMSVTHRMLRTMMRLGYVHQLRDRSYCLGAGLIRLGEGAMGQHIIAARPALATAAQQLGETATLSMLEDDRIVHVIDVQASRSLRSTVDSGSSAPAHETGTGRVLLSELEDEHVARTLTQAGITNWRYSETVMAAIRQIRRDGYCVDDGGQERGIRSFTVPVTGLRRPFAVNVAGSVDRLDEATDNHVITVLRHAALQISESLQPAGH